MFDKNPNKLTIIIVMLLIVPAIISFCFYAFHGKIIIGIVLEEGVESRFAGDAKDGLLLYDDYFEPRIVEDKFNSSNVRKQYLSYLSKDFNDPKFTKSVRNRNGVDVVLIISDKLLANWYNNRPFLLGEASIKSASAVMTVYDYQNESAWTKIHVMALAIHEVTHLVGFLHDNWDQESVMYYIPRSLNSSFYQSFEFPFKVTLAPLVLEKDTWAALLIMNILLALIFIPIVIAILIVIRIVISRRVESFGPTSTRLSNDISTSFLIMMITANVVLGIIISVMVVLLVNFLFYFASIVMKSSSVQS